MAQGLGKKVSNKKKSAASIRKQQSQKLKKGRKTYKSKGKKAIEARIDTATSKNIAKKNEITAAGKAIAAGNTFFLSEIKEIGKKENERLTRNQSRNERGGNNLTRKLTEKLRKLGKMDL